MEIEPNCRKKQQIYWGICPNFTYCGGPRLKSIFLIPNPPSIHISITTLSLCMYYNIYLCYCIVYYCILECLSPSIHPLDYY